MKKFILGFLLATFLVFTSAQPSRAIIPFGIYLGPRVGMGGGAAKSSLNSVQDSNFDHKTPFYGGFTIGFRLFSFRLDAEYSFENSITESLLTIGDIQKPDTICGHSLLANLYYNLIDTSFLKFYLNGGVGNTKFTNGFKGDEINKSLTWLAGGGITLSVLNLINFDVGYRFVDLGELDVDGIKSKQTSHNLYTGLRFGF
ncbi:MAG: hypothetical protein LBI29_00645 [Rickettsiales bacterium]|jgi:opacity protein-like surface antigen|nr:hypothetical protein [Rickettsiales bacterium]